MTPKPCPLCQPTAETVLYQDKLSRVIQVTDLEWPGFRRVIWQDHVAEMSDLPPEQQSAVIQKVLAQESELRQQYQPDKINLASLGNVVPHLHWHVVARFADDAQFPAPIWANAVREREPAALAELAGRLPAMDRLLAQALGEST